MMTGERLGLAIVGLSLVVSCSADPESSGSGRSGDNNPFGNVAGMGSAAGMGGAAVIPGGVTPTQGNRPRPMPGGTGGSTAGECASTAAEAEVGGTDGLRILRALDAWLVMQPAAAERRL